MTQGHTPGPWMRDGFAVTPYAPAGEKRRTICIASPDLKLSPKASMDQMRADARLMATAPELLVALCQYRDDLRYPPAPDSVKRRLEMIEDLIAKATEA